MPRKSKIQKVIEAAAEKPEPRTFQPYTYILCKRESLFSSDKIARDRYYLFMGWIGNGARFGENALLMDDRGPFTCSINEEDFEVCR